MYTHIMYRYMYIRTERGGEKARERDTYIYISYYIYRERVSKGDKHVFDRLHVTYWQFQDHCRAVRCTALLLLFW